jgi:hypothetical protein
MPFERKNAPRFDAFRGFLVYVEHGGLRLPLTRNVSSGEESAET